MSKHLNERTQRRIRSGIEKYLDDKPVVTIDGKKYVVNDYKIIGTLGKWGRA